MEPNDYKDIEDAIGKDLTIRLVSSLPYRSKRAAGFWRHRSLYVPKSLKGKSADRLVGVIGKDAAALLVQKFGGEIMSPSFPKSRYMAFRNWAIVEQHKGGASIEALSFLFDMTDRQIRNILKSL